MATFSSLSSSYIKFSSWAQFIYFSFVFLCYKYKATSLSLSTAWATLPRFWHVFMITFPTISGIGSHLPFDIRIFKQFLNVQEKKNV